MIRAIWIRARAREECAGEGSEAYGELECISGPMAEGQPMAHLSDGANLCEDCWNRLCDIIEAREGERPEIE